MISVIIPIYNCAPYLAGSLGSLMAQDFGDFEVIAVDDGSTDEGPALLGEMAGRFPRLRLLSTGGRRGAGAARNLGMDAARGEYLLFLDGDDSFSPKLLSHAYRRMRGSGAAVLVFGASRYVEATGREEPMPWACGRPGGLGRCFSAREAGDRIFTFTTPCPWNKLFRADFVREKGLRFQEIPRANDLYFVYGALCEAPRIALLEEPLVRYRVREGGLQRSAAETPTLYYSAYMALKARLEARGLYENCREGFIAALVSSSLMSLACMGEYEGFRALWEFLRGEEGGFPALVGQPRGLWGDSHLRAGAALILENPPSPALYAALRAAPDKPAFWREAELGQRPILKRPMARPYAPLGGEKKLSVLLPVYNTAPYLEACLESLLSQGLEDMEILAVNDGSTDESPGILRALSQGEPRLRVISQENRGLGAARNRALSEARGEYVYFMDSDDLLPPGALSQMLLAAEAGRAEILFFDGETLYESPALREEKPQYAGYYARSRCHGGPMAGPAMLGSMGAAGDYRASVCLQLFRRDFLLGAGLRFPEGRIYEDNPFSFFALLQAERALHLQAPLFLRRVREDSLSTKSPGVENLQSYIRCLMEMMDGVRPEAGGREARQGVQAVLQGVSAAAARCYWDMPGGERRRTMGELSALEAFVLDTRILRRGKESPKAPEGEGLSSLLRPQKLLGGLRCWREHGFGYTLRLGWRKIRGKGV